MPDESTPTPQAPCWVRIAAVQKGGTIHTIDSEVLNAAHARQLFATLQKYGCGMHGELWSKSFNRMIDQFTHANFPAYAT